ncbi:unnamed protein product [Pipistrellus nathusii]|uniref:Uncharacterized protein n=1 Tax=Pipistrellus nathusii TaxID=59473 RepID=A0ABN9ZLY8_PIPNA
MLMEMFSSHEVSHTHTYRMTHTCIHTQRRTHTCSHRLIHTYMYMHTDSELGELCGGRPAMGISAENCLCTTLDGPGWQYCSPFSPVAVPDSGMNRVSWNPFPSMKVGRHQKYTAGLGLLKKIVLNFGCLHSV